ncbi:MAG: hypothetical protein KDA88_06175 [Planctomycetaceae bacterium]|nr:hypothetical protein [Planctomycetaceae bacterium]MCB9951459.1 hypothetical protein [Planctomycetaceae bacterium]
MELQSQSPKNLTHDPLLWGAAVLAAVLISKITLQPLGIATGTAIAICAMTLALLLRTRQTKRKLLIAVASIAVLSGLVFTGVSLAVTGIAVLCSLTGVVLGLSFLTPSEIETGEESPLRESELVAVEPQAAVEADLKDFNSHTTLSLTSECDETEDDGLELLQHWERRRDLNGNEFIEGSFQVTLGEQEQRRLVHIPVHPPLSNQRNAWAEVVDGEGVTVELDAVLPYGLRLILRRRGRQSHSVTALVYISTSGTAQRRAA